MQKNTKEPFIDPSVKVIGDAPLIVDLGTHIEANCTIHTPAKILRGARISYSNLIHPYTTIASNSYLGDNNRIHKNVTIGESNKIYGTSTIHANSFTERGVVIREYTKIGKNVGLGENTRIAPNTVIGDGCRTMKNTFIGHSEEGVKIKNNVRIGENARIFADIHTEGIQIPDNAICTIPPGCSYVTGSSFKEVEFVLTDNLFCYQSSKNNPNGALVLPISQLIIWSEDKEKIPPAMPKEICACQETLQTLHRKAMYARALIRQHSRILLINERRKGLGMQPVDYSVDASQEATMD